MRSFIDRLLRDESGATAIEYGLICGLIFLAIVTAFGATSGSVSTLINEAFATISEALRG